MTRRSLWLVPTLLLVVAACHPCPRPVPPVTRTVIIEKIRPCLSGVAIPEWEPYQFTAPGAFTCFAPAAACLGAAELLAATHNNETAQRFYREVAVACGEPSPPPALATPEPAHPPPVTP